MIVREYSVYEINPILNKRIQELAVARTSQR